MNPKAAEPVAEPEIVVDMVAAPAEYEAPAAPEVEGAVSPPLILVEHADGQHSIIPIDYSCSMQIIDPFGVIKATVGFAGVNSLELVL